MWSISSEDAQAVMNSPYFKELERKISVMAELFAAMPEGPEKDACRTTLNDLVRKNRDRELAMELGRLEDEELATMERREMRKLSRGVRRWFPRFSEAEQEVVRDYAYALLSHHFRKMHTN